MKPRGPWSSAQRAAYMRKSLTRGVLLTRVLSAFENRGYLSPPTVWLMLRSRRVNGEWFPRRAVYSYLLRLHRNGLIARALDRRGLLLYRLTTRGAERLRWLRLEGSDHDAA
jgi:hypothetical protein